MCPRNEQAPRAISAAVAGLAIIPAPSVSDFLQF
jgi:hypothetical protein